MKVNATMVDKILHWLIVLQLLFMVNLSTELHYSNWEIKGALVHKQDALEFHSIVGFSILTFIITRIIYNWFLGQKLLRLPTKSKAHYIFIQIIHMGMYLALFLIIVSGIILISNYDIPISILGIELNANHSSFVEIYPKFQKFHIFLHSVFWCFVAIHVIGYLRANK